MVSLPLALWGAPAWYVETTGSTQDEVFALAEAGKPEGTLVQAGLQTYGRGRLGRQWTAPAGENLTFSFLTLRKFSYPPSLIWGLAVARYLESLGVQPQIKWPNDILVRGCKICGILVQSRRGTTVTGIGLNVNQRHFDPGLRRPATSLALLGVDSTPREVLGDLLPYLEDSTSLEDPGAAVERLLWGRGELQHIQLPDGTVVSGSLEGLGPGGEALLATEGGLKALQNGEWLPGQS